MRNRHLFDSTVSAVQLLSATAIECCEWKHQGDNMAECAKKLATIEDLISLPAEVRADLIDGEVEYRSLPSAEHEDVVDALITELRSRFLGPKRPDGRGGWWILSSTLIRFQNGSALCPDLVGWKRDRVPEKPKGFPVNIRPDWVCEVSFSTRRKDSTKVPFLLAENGVPWYWRFDIETENLFVYELVDSKYCQLMSLFREDGKVRIPPFDAVEFSMPILFGDDPEE